MLTLVPCDIVSSFYVFLLNLKFNLGSHEIPTYGFETVSDLYDTGYRLNRMMALKSISKFSKGI